jgi:hypothetical protein
MPASEMTPRTREMTARACNASVHRWGRRIPLELPVRIEFGGRVLGQGLLRNASLSGGLIETTHELPLFTNLVVLLPATGEAAHETDRLAACVVRRETAGFAVEWRDMACAPLVGLLERISGRRAANLRGDEASTQERASCAFEY